MGTPRHQLETTSTGRRAAVAAGLLAAAVVVVWFALLRGGGAEPELFAPADATSAATEAASQEDEEAQEEQEARPARGRVETFELFAAKDPFLPVVRPGGAGGGGGGSAEATTAGERGTATAGGEQIGGQRVRLVSASTRNGRPRAQVQVDSTVYNANEGEVFADNFQLLSVSGDCATMLFGDDQFTLCEGEEILK